MGLKGVKVNGQAYHFDHEYLENSPIPTYECADEIGKVLTVNDYGNLEWMTPSGGGAGGGSDIDQYIDSWDSSDVGRVLTVTSDCALGWTNILPLGGSGGNVLTMGPDGEPYWADAIGGQDIPSYSASDNNKVLSVVDGELEWMTPSMMPDLPTSDTHDTPYVLGADGLGSVDWIQIGGMMDSVLREHCDFNDNYVVDDGSGTPYVLVTSDNAIWWERLWDSDFDDYRLLPTYSMDDGKVLMVDSSAPAWVNAPWEDILPSIGNNDIGKVLRVTSDNHAEWDSELPSYGQSDAGKVLTVNNAGELEWAMPS